ncbi:CUB domain-containing protein [Thomomys bottae]
MTAVYNDCGGTIREREGKILNYNGTKMECVWTIEVKQDHRISVAIADLNLTCNKENLELFDGPPGSDPLGKYCEGLNLKSRSTTNHLAIRYSRDPKHPPTFLNYITMHLKKGPVTAVTTSPIIQAGTSVPLAPESSVSGMSIGNHQGTSWHFPSTVSPVGVKRKHPTNFLHGFIFGKFVKTSLLCINHFPNI